jgi:ABC-type uncharacterized transport system
MGVRRLTWLLVAGLAAVYIGERVVDAIPAVRVAFTGAGCVLVLAALGLRVVSWRRAAADARAVERIFVLGYAGCALALIGFLLAGDVGVGIGLPAGGSRFATAAIVLATILLAVSLLPVLAAQWAIGRRGRARPATGAVDVLRVRRLAEAALTVALTGASLMLVGWIASARDATLDLGYFRTASPGSAVTRIAESLGEPLRVRLFFPPASQVEDHVAGYFRALGAASGNVDVETHDRLAAPALAEEHGVTQDGTVVLAVGERREQFIVPTELAQARVRLRQLDETVQQTLMRAARDIRTVYFTVGHGELNDPSSAGPEEAAAFQHIDAFRSLFTLLHYRVADLGIQNGLGNAVPADAAMVIALGPRRAFLDAELAVLDTYLAGGGSLLLALEPDSDFDLGPLRQRLGVAFHDVPLADDQQHLRQRMNESDRRFIVTDRFSSHASVSTLGQSRVGAGIVLPGAGHLEIVADSAPQPTIVVRSLASTFADADRDFQLDDGTESRDTYPLVVAVEKFGGPADDARDDTEPLRAMVFADAELFSDVVITALGLNAALAADAVRWLGREEEMGGETTSEEDVPIVHTRAEDTAWFYATIFGAPALVLGIGLAAVARRRRRPTSALEEAT